MAWYQVSVRCTVNSADAVAAALERAGSVAVSFTDDEDDPVLEPPPGEAVLWGVTRVEGLFASAAPGDSDSPESAPPSDAAEAALETRLLAILDATPGAEREGNVTISVLEERDWVSETQALSNSLMFGNDLWIVPTGHTPPPDANAWIALDPGVAFGTGTHPTTHLCLDWLSYEHLAKTTVLDYGCGSGVLGVAALRLGASHAIMVDNDPQAVQASLENARRNNVINQAVAVLPGGTQAALSDAPPVDVLVANILLEPLLTLAPTLLNSLPAGAKLCLSGILATQIDELVDAYEPAVTKIEHQRLDDWARVTAIRNDTPIQ